LSRSRILLVILCAEDISRSYTGTCEYLGSLKTPRHTKATAGDHIDAATDYKITLDTLRKDRRQSIGRRIYRVTRTIYDLGRNATVVHRNLRLETRRVLAIRNPLAIDIILRRTDDTIETLADTLLGALLTEPLDAVLHSCGDNTLLQIDQKVIELLDIRTVGRVILRIRITSCERTHQGIRGSSGLLIRTDHNTARKGKSGHENLHVLTFIL
jgi:hypothetical protein